MENEFSFEISLSVLNHLGRNLYRSFVTVLGEAISNSWDANADNVNIYIDQTNNSLIIKDDGTGMSHDDFQNKFLKIGYSKRKTGETKSPGKNRPYIGRKGIGKLALLSCSDKITIMSRKSGSDFIGGTIDNTGLDKAIIEDMTPNQYKLVSLDPKIFSGYVDGFDHGTIIYFEKIKEGINKSPEYLRKLLALYFRFSLLDDKFNIFLNGEKISNIHLKDLGNNTQFLWTVNGYDDDFIKNQLTKVKQKRDIVIDGSIRGFIASVNRPASLKVISTDERVNIDLFANGRLRERDILKYMQSARIVENYLYGQIHYNDLDDDKDRFASSREGIVAEDPKFLSLLEVLKDKVFNIIINDWDTWRLKLREEGDPENTRISQKERKSLALFNLVSEEYTSPEGSTNKEKVDTWIDELADDAKYNFGSYAECFVSENLVRKYIVDKNVQLSTGAKQEVIEWRKREKQNKTNGNCNIDIRLNDSDTSYLDMDGLARLVDKQQGDQNCLPTDAKEYKPIRDALMHTALLTKEAKTKLTSVFNNIRGRIKTLLS